MEPGSLNFEGHDSAEISRLRAQWSEATDQEVRTVLFAPDADIEYPALGAVLEEFFRRGLTVPADRRDKKARSRLRFRSWSAAIWALAVYVLSCGLWWIVLFPMISGPGAIELLRVTGVLRFLLLVAPPGILTIVYLKGRLSRYLGDPEGYTRCGACAYILNGLKQLRCPKCGEVI